MEKNILVNISEKNIDGCGSDASVLVQFTLPADQAEECFLSTLKAKLTEIKKQATENDECLDTDDMVTLAIESLNIPYKQLFAADVEF